MKIAIVEDKKTLSFSHDIKAAANNQTVTFAVYSQKSKHQKTTVQKQNDCEKRRSKNKAARKAKKRK